MPVNYERIAVGLVTLAASFVLIAGDAAGQLDIGKFGYAGIGAWVTLVLQFYFRKNPRGTRP